jgi:hypothetical protein
MTRITTTHLAEGQECDCPTCLAVKLLARVDGALDQISSERRPCPVCRVVRAAIEARREGLQKILELVADDDDPAQAAETNYDAIDILVTTLDLELTTLSQVRDAAHDMFARGQAMRVFMARPRAGGDDDLQN